MSNFKFTTGPTGCVGRSDQLCPLSSWGQFYRMSQRDKLGPILDVNKLVFAPTVKKNRAGLKLNSTSVILRSILLRNNARVRFEASIDGRPRYEWAHTISGFGRTNQDLGERDVVLGLPCPSRA
jgi:hypothetical protein